MEKKLEHYLHFYIGQEAEVFWTFEDGRQESEGIGKIVGVIIDYNPKDKNPVTVRKKINTHSTDKVEYAYAYEDVKPLLRRLSDMTDEETLEYSKIGHKWESGSPASNITTHWAYKVCWLVQKGFDVFSLIKSGLAIDKTKREGKV